MTCQEDVVVQSDGHGLLQAVLQGGDVSPGGVPHSVYLGGGEPAIVITVLRVPTVTALSSHY